MTATTPVRFEDLGRLINTPLLAIRCRFRGRERVIYAKSEQLNMTGSIKDRMAFYILRRAYLEGRIRPGDRSWRRRAAIPALPSLLWGAPSATRSRSSCPIGWPQEREHLIASYGAEIVTVSAAEGGFLGSIRMAGRWPRASLMFPPAAVLQSGQFVARPRPSPPAPRSCCSWENSGCSREPSLPAWGRAGR